MTTYSLTVLTPDKQIFEGEVISVALRGHEGDLAVFAGHIPFVTTLQPCKCVVTLASEEEIEWDVTSGILDVTKDGVKLLIGEKGQDE